MHESLLVNPYELDDAAEVLHRALSMPLDEREVRMSYLRKREKTYDVNHWMRSFLKVVHTTSFPLQRVQNAMHNQQCTFHDFGYYFFQEMGSLTVEDGDEVLPTTMTPLTVGLKIRYPAG